MGTIDHHPDTTAEVTGPLSAAAQCLLGKMP
jgi:hypothetical protein